MKVALITPARLGSRSGNSITAVRWASILRHLGYEILLSDEFNGQSADMMIALNAYRTAGSIQRFRRRYPERSLVVALTGTDLYRFLNSHPERTMGSIEAADHLVVLNNLAHNVLSPDQRHKCFLILESAAPLPNGRRPSVRNFDVCVIGHLRPEKDPLRTAQAARLLPASSKIRVRHYGKAHTNKWAEAAQEEMAHNPRYTWFDEVPHWQIRRVLARSRLMVLSSNIEGGPNCLSEAIVAGLPVITTDIDGCLGVLGPDYPGTFPVGDTDALRRQLIRAESDPLYLAELERYVQELAPRLSRLEEESRWAELLEPVFNEV
jgi:putative glycosyltransferase (TIGR04348 family)